MEAVELKSEVMIWYEVVTLELREVEAYAREGRYKMHDDGSYSWFYRQHLEQRE